MGDRETVRAVLKLWLAGGVGSITFRRLVEAMGSAEAVADAPASQLQKVDGVGPKTAAAIREVTDDDVDSELAEANRAEVTILAAGTSRYPAALMTIFDSPPVLYVRGQLADADAVALGIVGARRCTHYGREQAQRFGALLGRAGFTVVSGGARGVDEAAHRGAIEAGGRTIAVMGCGLSHVYPPENAELFEQIVTEDRGAIVSELPMRTAVLAGNFPTRNRIISGLSLGVLVIEAARRSGSLITAREAAEQGREVFALPGPVDSTFSSGSNALIRDGAILVQDLDDILEQLGPTGAATAEIAEQEAQAQRAVPPDLPPVEKRLYDLLADRPQGVDELVRQSNLPSSEVIAAMTLLVLKGAIQQQPGNVFSRKR